jgi:hypothetical protein
MTKTTRRWCVSAALIGSMLAVMAGSNRADEKKEPKKHDASALNGSLRIVIDTGAEIYNKQGDHAGCYRIYQGGLLAVKPFVSPELQKRIDEGIGNAEKMGSYADRAFELRKVLDEIRTAYPAAKKDDKKQEEKKDKKDDARDGEEQKIEQIAANDKEEKKAEPAGKSGQASGTITYEGKPIAGGYSVIFVGKEKKKYTGPIQKDGTYQLTAPIPVGEYRVAIEPIADAKVKVVLPKRYASEETSGIAISVQAGKNRIELTLVK